MQGDLLKDKIKEKLSSVKYPGFERDIVSYGFLKNVSAEHGKVRIEIDIPSSSKEIKEALERAVKDACLDTGEKLDIIITQPKLESEKSNSKSGKNIAPQIKYFVMVSSGKGGVGKSTATLNLAISLAKMGKSVGLLDADIYGPNIPRMLGEQGKQPEIVGNKILPVLSHGVHMMSMGLLIEEGQGLMWRGAMIMKTIEQLLVDVQWPALDVLFLDMPPGTGDAQITLAQNVPVSAGVCVSTPQVVSIDDSKRSLDMFEKLHIPVAGIIENMSGFLCPDNGKEYPIFGKGLARPMADLYKTQLLAEIPLELDVREGGDSGKPVSFYKPQSVAATRYAQAATKLLEFLESNGQGSNSAIQPH